MTLITLKPVISEKSMQLAATSTYMFDVSPSANKPLVAKAVKEQFKVDVIQVRIAIIKGKVKKFKEGQVLQVLDTLFFDFILLAKKLWFILFSLSRRNIHGEKIWSENLFIPD